jgi:hypothetical protein
VDGEHQTIEDTSIALDDRRVDEFKNGMLQGGKLKSGKVEK